MFCVLSSGEVQESLDIGLTEVPPIRKPTKDSPWKESAVLQHRQQLKTKMKYHKVEDPKVPHAKQVENKKQTNKKCLSSPRGCLNGVSEILWNCREKFIFA